ncbi:hypothetical protein EV715DRAFT_268341 [Schizophyllum commune]
MALRMANTDSNVQTCPAEWHKGDGSSVYADPTDVYIVYTGDQAGIHATTATFTVRPGVRFAKIKAYKAASAWAANCRNNHPNCRFSLPRVRCAFTPTVWREHVEGAPDRDRALAEEFARGLSISSQRAISPAPPPPAPSSSAPPRARDHSPAREDPVAVARQLGGRYRVGRSDPPARCQQPVDISDGEVEPDTQVVFKGSISIVNNCQRVGKSPRLIRKDANHTSPRSFLPSASSPPHSISTPSAPPSSDSTSSPVRPRSASPRKKPIIRKNTESSPVQDETYYIIVGQDVPSMITLDQDRAQSYVQDLLDASAQPQILTAADWGQALSRAVGAGPSSARIFFVLVTLEASPRAIADEHQARMELHHERAAGRRPEVYVTPDWGVMPGSSRKAKKADENDAPKTRGAKSRWSLDRLELLLKWLPAYLEIKGDNTKSRNFWKDFLDEWFTVFPYHDQDEVDVPEGLSDEERDAYLAAESEKLRNSKDVKKQLSNFFNHERTKLKSTSARPFADFFERCMRHLCK